MSQHRSLPPQDAILPSNPPASQSSTDRVVELERFQDGGLPDRIAIKVQNGHRLYMAKIGLGGSNLKAVILFVHHLHFEEDAFNEKVQDACKAVLDRINYRRSEMADKKVPIENPVEMNESLFAGDMEYFEAVMIDKFQFRKLMYSVTDAEIEPTIKV